MTQMTRRDRKYIARLVGCTAADLVDPTPEKIVPGADERSTDGISGPMARAHRQNESLLVAALQIHQPNYAVSGGGQGDP